MARMLTTHPDYADAKKELDRINAALSIKGFQAHGTRYLTNPWGQIITNESGSNKGVRLDNRYSEYLENAVHHQFASQTLSAWVGLATRGGVNLVTSDGQTPVDKEVDENAELLLMDADGKGAGILNLHSRAIGYTAAFARSCILLLPSTAEHATRTERREGARTLMRLYSGYDVLDWDYEGLELVMVVLREQGISRTTGTAVRTNIYRRFELVDGVVKMSLGDDLHGADEFEVMDANGAPMDKIPLFWAGAEINNPDIDRIPIAPIVKLELGHYRNSAVNEECIRKVHPQLVLSGVSNSELEQLQDDGFTLFAGDILGITAPDARGEILQPEPGTLAGDGMKQKENAMMALGAKVVGAALSFNSASEAVINAVTSDSPLQTIADNVEAMFNAALARLAEMDGIDEYQINNSTNIADVLLDPSVLPVMLNAMNQQVVGRTDMQNLLRKHNLIERSNEDITEEIGIIDAGVIPNESQRSGRARNSDTAGDSVATGGAGSDTVTDG